ncbi:signal peptidase I [Streptomyces sp. SID8361]|uniref:signal peptidase I n=1 Tax=Streptomyces TaxID=1883 RepID=UPI00081E103A|nr:MULTISPECIES: signal peptidase I [Streptomyces]MYU14097.1 signal peptidase I [Streptomyces sp. SID8361]ATL85796.1 signal peptidase I [Streptomyces malaysiensis]MCM3807560.1 signal peptidase I [Streptomyces sp. DR7-3]QDL70526.1 signal peptidase I [Streptomyces malaysiensis]SCG04264.1 signal peptidase I [Streptomyces sp. MnatMP-M27]
MNTEGQLAERDRSPGSEKEHGERSRSSHAPARAGEPPSARWLPEWLTGGGRWRRAALLAAACAAVVLLVSGFVVQPFLIPSGSMENTLRPGDRVLVNKLAYRFGDDPRRGDVVVFDGAGSFGEEEPSGNPVTGLLRKAAAAVGLAEPAESDYVKRVVGIGGDRVTCCDKRGRIEVNGQPVDEGYLRPGDRPSRVRFDTVVPEGRLWVMGDHRDASRDSRDYLGAPGGGTVPVDKVIGRAEWIGWPFGRWSAVPRTDTFADVPAAPGGIPSAVSGGAHG